MELGTRLEAVVNMTKAAKCIADIGCDHGFVSIALVQRNLAESVIACDVKKGPLEGAKEHVAAAGLKDKIDCRLADGLMGLNENEADGIIIAGMGGPLGLRILYDGREKLNAAKQIILQIQSKQALVRYVLDEWDFNIVSEEMVTEDGKYYVLLNLEVPKEPGGKIRIEEAENFEDYLKRKEEELSGKSIAEQADYTYGADLISKKSPVLLAFLEKEEERLLSVAEKLSESGEENSESSLNALGRLNTEIDILMNAKWRICGGY